MKRTNTSEAEAGSDVELRAEELQTEANEMLEATGILDEVRCVGETHLVGSVVSELMTRREIDITVAAGHAYGPSDALRLVGKLTRWTEVVDITITDERNDCSVAERDRRVHLQVGVLFAGHRWELDISLFALDAHENVAEWHRKLRLSLTPEQRRAILTIKRDLLGADDYPGGLAIYEAVVNDAVTDTHDFIRRRTQPVVRDYRESDALATLEIFIRAILQGARDEYTVEQTEAWLGRDVLSSGWHEARSGAATVVAELDGRVVGFADLDPTGYIDRLFTHPSATRRGVASALLTEILGRARNRGIAELSAYASALARPVFERFGFVVESEETAVRHGIPLDRYSMRVDLREQRRGTVHG